MIVNDATGYADGPQTIWFQFGRDQSDDYGAFWFVPYASAGDAHARKLHRWCKGYYHGYVAFEGQPASVVVSRFFFIVR